MITTTTTLYAIYKNMQSEWLQMYCYQGRIQDFKLGGGALKKIAPSGGRREHFGVYRVKNHDFTPKNHIPVYKSSYHTITTTTALMSL
jgi:hypothetical protein